MVRIPDKSGGDEIKEMLKQICGELKEIRRENQEYREELVKIREENSIFRKELEENRKRIAYIEEKLEYIERENIRNNIVMKGLELQTIEQEGLKEKVKNFLSEYVGVTAEIRRIRRIKENICVVQLNSWEEKLSIMENKRKLGNLRIMKVYIDNDLTKREQEVQKKIREIAKNERSKGTEVRVGYNKLWINREKWVWNRSLDRLEKWRVDGVKGRTRDKQEEGDSKN
jgi:hypothetical protein